MSFPVPDENTTFFDDDFKDGKCVPTEFGRASDAYIRISAVYAIVFVIAILSGAALWFKHRKKVYLARRNPVLISFFLIPVLANLLSGAIYRISLNRTSIFNNCFVVNISFALVVPTVFIPHVMRMINFYHRIRLNRRIRQLNSYSKSNSSSPMLQTLNSLASMSSQASPLTSRFSPPRKSSGAADLKGTNGKRRLSDTKSNQSSQNKIRTTSVFEVLEVLENSMPTIELNAEKEKKGSLSMKQNLQKTITTNIKGDRSQPISIMNASTGSFSLFQDKSFNDLNVMRQRAGTMRSVRGGLTLLVFSIFSATIYTILTCPVRDSPKSQDIDNNDTNPTVDESSFLSNCAFADVTGLALVFVLLPVATVFLLYFYFRHYIKHIPDPFNIKQEITRFMMINFFIALPALLLTMFDVGKFSINKADDIMGEIGDRETEDEKLLYFKWLLVADLSLLLSFLNSVHYEVYLATRGMKFKEAIPYGLKEILQTPEGQDLFAKYLETEYSVENLIIYQILIAWRSRYDQFILRKAVSENPTSSRDRAARAIFRNWMDPTNENVLGVNVSADAIRPIQEAVETRRTNVPKDFFDQVISELFHLMASDSFPRFTCTNEYKEFVGTKDPGLLEDDFWIEHESCCTRLRRRAARTFPRIHRFCCSSFQRNILDDKPAAPKKDGDQL